MKIKVKKLHKDAVLPTKGEPFSAGFDLTAISKEKKYCSSTGNLKYISYDFGFALEIPSGHVGLIFPRSSISNYNMDLSNSVGVIDESFRGSVSTRFRVTGPIGISEYDIGDKVAQLIILPYPKVEFELSDELSVTERGEGGYGSTNGDKCLKML